MKIYKIAVFIFTLAIIGNTYSQIDDTISTAVVYPADSDSIINNVNPTRSNEYGLLENIWIPGEDGGGMPIDIMHIETATQNKVYVYAKSRVLVFDAANNTQLATIDISDSSQYMNILVYDEERYSSQKYLAYNEADHLLYCVNEHLQIVAIDTDTDSEAELLIDRPSNLSFDAFYATTFLEYNPTTEQLYWAISYSSAGSDLYIYDIYNLNNPHKESYSNPIYDLKINVSRSEYYLSIGRYFKVYDANTFYQLKSISNGSLQGGDMLLVNDNGINKLFCFSRKIQSGLAGTVHVIDFNNSSQVSTFTQPDATQTACYYNPSNQRVYVGLHASTNDLWIFNAGDHSTEVTLNTDVNYTFGDDQPPLSINKLAGKIILTKQHEIVAVSVDENDNYSTTSVKSGFNNYFYRSAVVGNKAFAIGAVSGTLEILIPDVYNEITLDETIQTGGIAYFGCFNPSTGKAYYYSDQLMDNSNVYILNTATNEINVLEIGSHISGMDINLKDNHILVSEYTSSGSLHVIDGDTDLLLDPTTIQFGNGGHHCSSVYFSENGKLYCIVQRQQKSRLISFSVNSGIYSLDNGTGDYNEYNYPHISGEFCYNPSNGKVYVTIKDISGSFPSFGLLTEVSHQETPIFTDYTINNKPFHIECSAQENKIYISHLKAYIYYLTVFNCRDQVISQLIIPTINSSSTVYDLEYDDLNGCIYAVYNNTNYRGEISIIENTSISSTIDVPTNTSSLKYNDLNRHLYSYMPYNYNSDKGTQIWEMLVTKDDLGNYSHSSRAIPLNNKHAPKLGGGFVNHDILMDQNSGYIYVANAAFSNISKVQMAEIYELGTEDNDDYKWLSFPRLVRDINAEEDVQTVLGGNRIVPNNYNNGSNLQFMNLDDPQLPVYNTVTLGDWQAEGDLDKVASTLGYKLQLKYDNPYPDNSYIYFYGNVLDENENVVVYEDKESWVGYWLTEEQSPFEAIPESVLDYLDLIKTERWVCVKEWLPVNGMLEPQWVCGTHTSSNPTLRYADLVIFESFANENISFPWVNSGSTSTSSQKGAPENYNFDEQADYTSYIIELDATDNPEEIAAFVGDTCVGASKVLPADTAVLVPGYTEGFEGEVIFEEYYGVEKSGKPAIKSYYVNNPETRSWDKRSIHTAEENDHYLISFKKDSKISDEPKTVSYVNIWPNPASDKVKYNIQAEKGTLVQIYLLDIAGRMLNTPFAREMHSESISGEIKMVDSKGHQLKPGIYLVEIKAGQTVETKKIIVK